MKVKINETVSRLYIELKPETLTDAYKVGQLELLLGRVRETFKNGVLDCIEVEIDDLRRQLRDDLFRLAAPKRGDE